MRQIGSQLSLGVSQLSLLRLILQVAELGLCFGEVIACALRSKRMAGNAPIILNHFIDTIRNFFRTTCLGI